MTGSASCLAVSLVSSDELIQDREATRGPSPRFRQIRCGATGGVFAIVRLFGSCPKAEEVIQPAGSVQAYAATIQIDSEGSDGRGRHTGAEVQGRPEPAGSAR